MRITIPNLLFFGMIGFTADLFNFAGAQAEILAATFVFHATGFQLGLLGAFSSLFYAIPTMFTGLLSERIGRRPLVLLAIFGMGASYAWGANAGSIQQLYGVATLRAISTACLWPSAMAWMARAVPRRKFSRFLGSYNVSWATGTFIGFWAAGYLFQQVGWASPFWAATALAIFLFIFVLFTAPHGGNGIALPPDNHHDDEHQLDDKQTRYFVRLGLIMALSGMIASSLSLYIFPKIGQGLISESQISFLNSIRLLGQMLAFYLMGRYAHWHFRQWPVYAMAAILIIGLLLTATGHTYTQFVIGYSFIGIGFGAGFSMCAYYALGLSQSKGKASGLMETTIGVGGLSGSMLGGGVSALTAPRTGILSGIFPVAILAVLATRKWVQIRK